MRRAALTTIVLAVLFVAYVELLAPHVPSELAIVFIIAMLVLFGIASYFGCRKSPWLIGWLIVAPIVVLLPPMLYLGDDPAKPGLGLFVYYIMVIVMGVAELLAWMFDRFVLRRNRANAEA